MNVICIAIALAGMATTLLGLLFHLLLAFKRPPSWIATAGELTPQSLESLATQPNGWVWLSTVLSPTQHTPGLLHKKTAWVRTTVYGDTAARPVLTEQENPKTLVIGEGDQAVAVRVGELERGSVRQDTRDRNPFSGERVPGELAATVTVYETALIPGDHVSVIGKLSREHGRTVIRAHYDDARVWRGSEAALRAAVAAHATVLTRLAPACIYYGGFAAIIGLLLWSMIAK
jgi:hypothetical protein